MQFAQSLDWYLSPPGEKYRPEIHRVAAMQPSDHADALLLGYVLEGIRMAGSLTISREAISPDLVREDDGRDVQVRAGTHVFLPSALVSGDAEQFPNPDTVDPRRPAESYVHYGAGPQAFLGKDICDVVLVELFRAIFRKKGLRGVPGPQGQLKKIVRSGAIVEYMTEDWGAVSPFPTTMKVMWDAE